MFALLCAIACGGGSLAPLLGANYFAPSVVGRVEALGAGSATIRVASGITQDLAMPPAPAVAVGDRVMALPSGSLFADRAYLPNGSPSVRVVDLATNTPYPLPSSVGANAPELRLEEGLALPPGRWRLEFNGLIRFFAQTKTAAMDVKQLAYEFDVRPDGTTSLPAEVYGDLPKNGKTLNQISLSGRATSVDGFGTVAVSFSVAGRPDHLLTTNKFASKDRWTWVSSSPLTCPEDGWDSITVRCAY